MEELIGEILVPTQEKIVAKHGKKKSTEEKLFPGYILVNMVMTEDTRHMIRTTEGVTGFVGQAKDPKPLKEEEVKAITDFSEIKQTSYKADFRVGDPVKVTEGPFKELIGEITEINESKGQLTVLLSMFGREVPTQLDFLQVTNLANA
jgi:transcriptional antiterminator NusG